MGERVLPDALPSNLRCSRCDRGAPGMSWPWWQLTWQGKFHRIVLWEGKTVCRRDVRWIPDYRRRSDG